MGGNCGDLLQAQALEEVIKSIIRPEIEEGQVLQKKKDETVPQTDTGGRDEYSKALERTREKELGKLVP